MCFRWLSVWPWLRKLWMRDWEKMSVKTIKCRKWWSKIPCTSLTSVSCSNQSWTNGSFTLQSFTVKTLCSYIRITRLVRVWHLHISHAHSNTHRPVSLSPGHIRCVKQYAFLQWPKTVTRPYHISTGKPQLLDATHARGGGAGHEAAGSSGSSSSSCRGWRNFGFILCLDEMLLCHLKLYKTKYRHLHTL